jgi:hypothetical protein
MKWETGFPFEEQEPQSKRLWLHSFRRNLPILDITKACLDSTQHFLVLSPFFSYNLPLYYLFPLSKAPESSLKNVKSQQIFWPLRSVDKK